MAGPGNAPFIIIPVVFASIVLIFILCACLNRLKDDRRKSKFFSSAQTHGGAHMMAANDHTGDDFVGIDMPGGGGYDGGGAGGGGGYDGGGGGGGGGGDGGGGGGDSGGGGGGGGGGGC
ncbi:glycine-rich protein DOT1-like [Impatiens glandulifera]|uniref:glycine-rich protein DOT1-like n=1 Tax=Impatiens glandulifera TaxID=253017 RepID=UPI001FB17839|nr:glycine-rich protein DOT1-like [Impatiens glandulifera]